MSPVTRSIMPPKLSELSWVAKTVPSNTTETSVTSVILIGSNNILPKPWTVRAVKLKIKPPENGSGGSGGGGGEPSDVLV